MDLKKKKNPEGFTPKLPCMFSLYLKKKKDPGHFVTYSIDILWCLCVMEKTELCLGEEFLPAESHLVNRFTFIYSQLNKIFMYRV